MKRVVIGFLATMLSACGSSGSGNGGTGATTSGGGAAGAGGTVSGGGSGGTSSGGAGGSGGSGGQAGGSAATGGTTSDGGNTNPVVELDTSLGKMTIELDPVRMPNTTANFLEYVDSGFYSSTIIHRVIPDFVIQGGGFTSGMTQKATNPPIALETSPEILHDYGVISMARTTAPDSATSQFFVVNGAAGAHSLDGKYAAFGHLLTGKETLDAISKVATQTVGQFDDVPVEDVVINSATRK